MTAAGRMIDFRYRVLDPVKAAQLTQRSIKPRMIELKTGTELNVPSFPKAGSLRQTSMVPLPGRVYFALFFNRDGAVHKGDRVTV